VRRSRLRVWLPFVAAALALLATRWTGAVLTVILMIAALGLVLDGATLLWSRSGSGLTQNRQ
jgi:hypothetical protein